MMRATTLTALFSLVLAAGTSAQEPRPSEVMGGDSDPQQEIREIFARVERVLRKIDVYLSDAAAGDVPLELPEKSGLGDLLRETKQQSQEVARDMDRLLQLASEQKPQGQGGGGSRPQPSPGESPLDQNQNREQQPERTPEQPESGEEEGGEKPSGEKPGGSEDSDEDPENRRGETPPESGEGPPQRGADEGESWGELPPRVREVFRSQGGGDLPVQYRDWIDSYYRRLNRRP